MTGKIVDEFLVMLYGFGFLSIFIKNLITTWPIVLVNYMSRSILHQYIGMLRYPAALISSSFCVVKSVAERNCCCLMICLLPETYADETPNMAIIRTTIATITSTRVSPLERWFLVLGTVGGDTGFLDFFVGNTF